MRDELAHHIGFGELGVRDGYDAGRGSARPGRGCRAEPLELELDGEGMERLGAVTGAVSQLAKRRSVFGGMDERSSWR